MKYILVVCGDENMGMAGFEFQATSFMEEVCGDRALNPFLSCV